VRKKRVPLIIEGSRSARSTVMLAAQLFLGIHLFEEQWRHVSV